MYPQSAERAGAPPEIPRIVNRQFSVRAASEFAHDISHKSLGVAEEHEGFILVVKRVIDAGKAGAQTPLDDHDGAGLIDLQDGHAVDGAGLIGLGGGIGDVVGADDSD